MPLIDLGYYTSHYDLVTMREAIKGIRPLAEALEGYVVEPVGRYADALADGTDEAIEGYLRDQSFPIFHASSTAAMTRWDSDAGVLNPDLTVKDTVGLRVVDASAFVREALLFAARPILTLLC